MDESSNARRAVFYVAQLFGGVPDFRAYLLHVLSQPEEDFFPSAAAKESYLQKHRQEIGRILEEYRQILVENGFAAEEVSTHAPERYCPSIADCILAEEAAPAKHHRNRPPGRLSAERISLWQRVKQDRPQGQGVCGVGGGVTRGGGF